MSGMIQYLRELHFASVVVRLALAMLLGGCIGLERGRKRRPAGFRTYMLVCLGAALTVLLSLYEFYHGDRAVVDIYAEIGIKPTFRVSAHRSSTASAFWAQEPFSLPAASRSRA